MKYLYSLFLSTLIFITLVEILSPAKVVIEEIPVEITELEKAVETENDYANMEEVEWTEEMLMSDEEPEIASSKISQNSTNYFSDILEYIYIPKIVDILKNSDYGFIFFYFLIFSTLFLQIFYYFSNSEISYLAVDFNLQAPPMLGVGGTIYALVNSDISGSTSIIETLTAILLGAGLTTLLGIFVFVINHFLSRYIKTV